MQSFWKSHFLTLFLIAIDMLALSILWQQAWYLRAALTETYGRAINELVNYRHALPFLVFVWFCVLAVFKQYAHKARISSLNEIGDILKAIFFLYISTLAFAQLTKGYFDLGNSVILPWTAMTAVYIYTSRSVLRYAKEKLRKRGVALTRAAIIGAGETGRRVALRIQSHPEIGYQLAGFIDRRAAELGPEVGGVPLIGDGSNLVDTLLRHRVEEVFLAVPSMCQSDVFDMVLKCEAAHVYFKIVKDDLLEVITDRVKIDDIGDFPVILMREGRLSPYEVFGKRLLDLAVSVPAMILTAPLWIGIAVAIKLDSSGPVLFSHERVGQDGKIFTLHKFRTMSQNANPYAVAPGDQGDPRITRLGRFLRKTSLDELPQLWNVVRGDMSLVGPRPEMPFIVEKYEPWQRRRLDVPQGLTGLWQIAGRKQLPLHYNLEYDFYYIRNWSLLMDLIILVRTIPAVLFGKGAF